MNQTEFDSLHTSCVTALGHYVTSAQQTADMLAKCTPEPMALGGRLDLLVQEDAEEKSHSIYKDLKRLLNDAARLGYHFSDCTNRNN